MHACVKELLDLRARERHSKRLRGETVDKHIMFDDPELAARRKRQATLGESAARAASKQARAVRFQQPMPYRTSPDGLAEEEALPDAASHMDEGEHLPAETPHIVSNHSTLPDSAGSGLNLTLPNSAAQRGSTGLPDDEEEEGEHGTAQHSANIVPGVPASSTVSGSVAPPLNPPAGDPPDTTGKLLVKSKNSLEEAQSIAQGILGSGPIVPAIGSDIPPARRTSGLGAKPAAAADSAASAAKKLPALSQQPRDLNGGSPLPAESARETDPVSSVLASTTRPNVPSKVGGNPAQLKPIPPSASRLAHAGHTPYLPKHRMTPVDPQPNASPQGSVGVMGVVRGVSKDPEGATPAATLRPFAGATPYPSVNPSMPVEDTPMVDSGALQHRIAPDSCVGQVSSETTMVVRCGSDACKTRCWEQKHLVWCNSSPVPACRAVFVCKSLASLAHTGLHSTQQVGHDM